jgi:hypothetical protein
MNRTRGLGLLLVTTMAVVAFSTAATAHKNHKHVLVFNSKISIEFQGGGEDPYAEQANFRGRVRANAGHGHSHGHHGHHRTGGNQSPKASCVKDRRVEIFRKNGPRIARTRTDRKGDYAVRAGPDFVAGKKYFATVDKTTLRKGKKKIVCRGAASDVITAG